MLHLCCWRSPSSVILQLNIGPNSSNNHSSCQVAVRDDYTKRNFAQTTCRVIVACNFDDHFPFPFPFPLFTVAHIIVNSETPEAIFYWCCIVKALGSGMRGSIEQWVYEAYPYLHVDTDVLAPPSL